MLFAPLESALNRNIAASSAARSAAKRLDGRSMRMSFVAGPTQPLFAISLTCNGEQLRIATAQDTTPDATLTGTPLAYLSMVGAAPESAMRSGHVRIEGNAEVAQAFRDLLQASRPDVEEELARLVGDLPAHQLGRLARGAFSFGKRAVDTFAQNVSEFLQEETRDVVTRIEVDEFSDAVDRIRDDVERLEARMRHWQRS